MNISQKLDRLMEFIYDEYDNSSRFHQYGEYGSTLVSRFVRKTGINFGNAGAQAGAQLDAIRLLLEQGFIEIVETSRTRIRPDLSILTKIRPTPKGIQHVESRRQPWLNRHGPRLIKELIDTIIKVFKP